MIDMDAWAWKHFKDGLKDTTPEGVNWRPLPQANTINAIVRHLRIEAQWHLASLAHGVPTAAVIPILIYDDVGKAIAA